jgi:hypothetical protein
MGNLEYCRLAALRISVFLGEEEARLSAQVEIEIYTWDALSKHLKTGNIVDYVVNELEWVKAQLSHAEAPKWT